MRLSHLLATASAVAGLALAPSTASAAAGVTSVVATPGSTQAGAHADFTIDMTFGADDDLRDLVIRLPKGFVGNPQAVGLCTQAQFASDACPPESQVGTVVVTATVTPSSLLPSAKQTQQVAGKLFNLEPKPGEPARLGVLLPSTSTAGLVTTRPVRMQAVVSVRTGSDYGLDSTQVDTPRTIETNVGPLAAHIDRIQLTLWGRVPGASQPYLTNPTTCTPATTTVVTTSYNGATASSASAYTPTSCEALAYAPTISATIDGGGPKQHPRLTTVVSQAPDEATSRKTVVTLPFGVAANIAALSKQCPSADFDAGTCPDATQVGTATSASPLLAEPLTGPVYLVANPAGGLPQLGIALGGLIPVKLRANVGIGEGARQVSTLDDLPDVPLSRFELVLGGPDRPLLIATHDLCASPGTIDATFTAHAGLERTVSATPTATNCVAPARGGSAASSDGAAKSRRPAVKARLTRSGALVVTAKVPRGAAKLRRLRVALPPGLEADAARRLRAKRAKGARRLSVRVGSKHLTVRRAALGKRPRVTVVATTVTGRSYRTRAALR
ncbi:MAG TPA: hypothetical protein VFR97_02245 [Capillimicrobium sp.]|nr:hypothetical protein [Capillimicrobium sp.]